MAKKKQGAAEDEIAAQEIQEAEAVAKSIGTFWDAIQGLYQGKSVGRADYQLLLAKGELPCGEIPEELDEAVIEKLADPTFEPEQIVTHVAGISVKAFNPSNGDTLVLPQLKKFAGGQFLDFVPTTVDLLSEDWVIN